MKNGELASVFKWLNQGLVEIRVILLDGRVRTGWARSPEEFAELCREYEGEGQIYVSVNEKDGHGGKLENVVFLTNIIIDLDSVRPKPR